MNGRVYDPLLGRMNSPDNFVQNPMGTQGYNRYSYANNNPLKYTDPTGNIWGLFRVVNEGANWLSERASGNSGYQYNMGYAASGRLSNGWQNNPNVVLGPNGYPIGPNGEYNAFGGYGGYNIDEPMEAPYFTDASGIQWERGTAWKSFYADGTINNGATTISDPSRTEYFDSFYWRAVNKCPDCLDPSTVGKNIGGLTYPGGNNPKSYNKEDNFSYVPTNLAEYPAIGHDRRYYKIGTAGAKGLFTDTRVVGADWKFVHEQIQIAANPYLKLTDRLTALGLGIGLGLAATPKTILELSKPFGLGYYEVNLWYNVSNIGVTNKPTIHTH